MRLPSDAAVIHALAVCNDCSWKDDHYHTAETAAASHARMTKHSVRVELGVTYTVRIFSKKGRP